MAANALRETPSFMHLAAGGMALGVLTASKGPILSLNATQNSE